jgi:hypothetical protein
VPSLTGRGQSRKLVDRVFVAHRPVALSADRPEVVDVGRTTLAFRDVVADLKLEGRHDVFAPRHEALVFKEPVAAPHEPYLLSQRTWYFKLHN